MDTNYLSKTSFGFKPKGFSKLLLDTQKSGLTGHIEELFPDLSASSAWLGGKGEAWERGPYYLDGLIPLAYLTKDTDLLKKVERWSESILESQNEEGFFGSPRSIDWWPRMVVAKAFVTLHRANGDDKILEFLTKYFHYQLKHIDEIPLSMWGKARSLESVEAILYLYDKTRDDKLLVLSEKLIEQGFDFIDYFENLPITKPTDKYIKKWFMNTVKVVSDTMNDVTKHSQKPEKPKSKTKIEQYNDIKFTRNYLLSHGVNVSMMIKYPIYVDLLRCKNKGKKAVDIGYENLLDIHGTALQIHSTDEHLMGNSPCQGVELCAVAEQMYSYGEMFRVTGDFIYQEKNQFLYLNVLPLFFNEKMTAHQYVTQTNQVRADKVKRQFYDTGKEGNIFGIAPNFGCCAANMHQGFPKYIDSSIFYGDNCCYITQYVQGEFFEKRKEGTIGFELVGNFPYENTYEIRIKEIPKHYLFKIRILDNYKVVARLDGEALEIRKDHFLLDQLKPQDSIVIELTPLLKTIENADKTCSFSYGAFLLANKIKAKEVFIKGEKPFQDRGFLPLEPFNFIPILKEKKLQVIKITSRNELDEIPFNRKTPHIEIVVKGIEVTNWRQRKNSADDKLEKVEVDKECEITLVPIAETILRITHFYKYEVYKGEENG